MPGEVVEIALHRFFDAMAAMRTAVAPVAAVSVTPADVGGADSGNLAALASKVGLVGSSMAEQVDVAANEATLTALGVLAADEPIVYTL